MKVSGNKIFCERCKRWFFSRKYAESGQKVSQCPLCKRYDWEVVKD